jgi:uncharacterized membrane protein
MLSSAAASWLHIVGLAAMFVTAALRGLAIRALPTQGTVEPSLAARVFYWDNLSGVAVTVAMGSGLWRLFGDLEKGTAYYTGSSMFWLKMGLLGLGWAMECVPMFTFIAWRRRVARHEPIDAARVRLIRRVEPIELGASVAMVLVAALMARGFGQPTPPVTSVVIPTRGEQLYQTYCVACHQADGGGRGGQLAAPFVGEHSRLAKLDDELLAHIARGVPGTTMLGFDDRLTKDDQREVLRYIRARFTANRP